MYRFEPLAECHLEAARALSAQQSWLHGVAEWRQMLSLGQGVAVLADDRLVGTTIWWRHDRAATLGMVIVDQACRGQGIAGRMVQAALDDLDGLPVLLCATDMARGGYGRLGFREAGAVDTCRGVPVPLEPDARIEARFDTDVVDLDAAARGWNRAPVLRSLVQNGATAWCLMQDGRAVAYALDRQAASGRVIGPIAAPDVDTAMVLVRHCLALHPGISMRIDSDPALGLGAQLPDLGLPRVRWGTVMVHGTLEARPEGAPLLYGLASQAFN